MDQNLVDGAPRQLYECSGCGAYVLLDDTVCPNCGGEISESAGGTAEEEPYECDECGANVSLDDTVCPKCGADISEVDDSAEEEPPAEPVGTQQTQQLPSGNPVLNRYRDLYRVARLLVTIGNTVKVIGIIVGAGILMLSLAAGGTAGSASMVGALGVAGALYGAIVGGFIALMGIITAAQGQMLLAQADSAVHTSPFMTNDEKAKVMSL